MYRHVWGLRRRFCRRRRKNDTCQLFKEENLYLGKFASVFPKASQIFHPAFQYTQQQKHLVIRVRVHLLVCRSGKMELKQMQANVNS